MSLRLLLGGEMTRKAAVQWMSYTNLITCLPCITSDFDITYIFDSVHFRDCLLQIFFLALKITLQELFSLTLTHLILLSFVVMPRSYYTILALIFFPHCQNPKIRCRFLLALHLEIVAGELCVNCLKTWEADQCIADTSKIYSRLNFWMRWRQASVVRE